MAEIDCQPKFTCNELYGPAGTGLCMEGKEGTRCLSEAQCSSGLVCTNAKSLGGEKSCHLAGSVGDPCISTLECKKPAVCSMAYGPAGQGQCRKGVLGDLCESGSDCADDLICGNVEESSVRVCRVPGRAGAYCVVSWDCEEGSYCRRRDSSSHGTCVESELGDPCTNDAECGPTMVCDEGHDPPVCDKSSYTACAKDWDCGQGSVCKYVLGGLNGNCSYALRTSEWYCTKHTTSGWCYEPNPPCADYGSYTVDVWEQETCGQCAPEPGSQPEGSLCTATVDCVGGLVCSGPYPVKRCHQKVPVGEPCRVGGCEDGAFCYSQKCITPLEEGEACEKKAQCAGHLVCPTEEPKVCEKPLYLSCKFDEECGDEMMCAGVMGGFDGSCHYMEEQVMGLLEDGCYDWDWVKVLTYCKQCVPLFGSLSVGDKCPDSSACAQDLVCGALTKRCVAPVGIGAPCETSDDCWDDLVCTEGEGGAICALPKKLGDPCAGGDECPAKSICLSTGTCGLAKDLGDACGADLDCLEGLVCEATQLGSICASTGAIGSHCHNDEDCEPSLFCSTKSEVCMAPYD